MTKSLTILKDCEGKKDLLTLFSPFGGDPGTHGKRLKVICESLIESTLTEGTLDRTKMGRCAVGLVTSLGNVAIYPNGSKNVGEEFFYVLSPLGKSFTMKVYGIDPENFELGCTQLVYTGRIEEFQG